MLAMSKHGVLWAPPASGYMAPGFWSVDMLISAACTETAALFPWALPCTFQTRKFGGPVQKRARCAAFRIPRATCVSALYAELADVRCVRKTNFCALCAVARSAAGIAGSPKLPYPGRLDIAKSTLSAAGQALEVALCKTSGRMGKKCGKFYENFEACELLRQICVNPDFM